MLNQLTPSRLTNVLFGSLGFVFVCIPVAAEKPTPAQTVAMAERIGKAFASNVEQSDFHGFVMHTAMFDSAKCMIVQPKNPAPGNPWVWRARFWGHQPAFDTEMLNRGWHVAYCDVGGLFGCDRAVKRWSRFYNAMQSIGMNDKPFLEAMSRGGLIVMRWASRYPTQVSGIYVDNAVMDFRSWPAARFSDRQGVGKGSDAAWKQCLSAYGISESDAISCDDGPLDRLDDLAKENVPIFALINEADEVVPPAENGDLLVERYQALGAPITVMRRPGLGHHPHGLKDPQVIVDFALQSLRGIKPLR